jgi:Flp pilus assembly protein TadG
LITAHTIRQPLKALWGSALRRFAQSEHGSALVESAISMSLFFALLFGVIQVSWAVYSYHYVANAAHEGARYAMVRGGTWIPSCDGSGSAGSGYNSSQCQATIADIQDYVANRSFPGVNITPSDVCVEYFASVPTTASTTCTASSNFSDNAQGDVVQVTVTYPFTLSVPLVRSHTIQLSSTSQMIIAQ